MAVLIRASFTTLYVLLFTLLSMEAIAGTNLAPTALAVTTSTKEDTKKSITLKGSDPEKKKLTYAIVTQPANGTVTLKGNIATYTPTLNYASASTSPDSFTFKVNDGSIDSAPAAVYIAVTPVNDKPVAQGGNTFAVKNATRDIMLSGLDADGDTLTYIPSSKSKKGGTVKLVSNNLVTYAPKKDFFGTDSFTFTVKDNQKAVSTAATINVSVQDNSILQPTPTGKLNDTGITTCGDETQNNQPCPVLGHDGQDGDVGRDVVANNNNDGHAGFNFTKIGSNGSALAIQSETYNDSGTEAAGTKWSCVKDNVTGLIWEIKTNDNSLHGKNLSYSWSELSGVGVKNGGSCGGTSKCDTYAYTQAVNAASWCGAKDWRLPTKSELLGLLAFDRNKPAIDEFYFPNTPSTDFWSSTEGSQLREVVAWLISFDNGKDSWGSKKDGFQVRLVRGEQ